MDNFYWRLTTPVDLTLMVLYLPLSILIGHARAVIAVLPVNFWKTIFDPPPFKEMSLISTSGEKAVSMLDKLDSVKISPLKNTILPFSK